MWDGRADHVRKLRSGFTQDVFSAEVWLASAPLHEAGKTTRSGNTLKTGIGRGQLSFASDNPSSNPNACPLISIFSKPHSEVASTTHTSAPKCFRKDAQRFSTFIRPGVHTAKSRFTHTSGLLIRTVNCTDPHRSRLCQAMLHVFPVLHITVFHDEDQIRVSDG